MSKKPVIDFTGATFEHGGRVSRTLADGTEIDVRYIQKIMLADGTIYTKDWPWWVWKKWLPNKDYRYFGDTRGWFRKVNDRFAWMLDKAWKENFKPAPEDA